MSEAKDQIETLQGLKSKGRRLTKVRRELIEYILSIKDHWTIQDLGDRVAKEHPSIGIATVYRTVNLLVEEGSITRTVTDSGVARFEVTPKSHHDHLSCVRCGKIVEFENDQIEKLQEKIARENGFKLTDHRMELFGECKDCQKPRRRAVKEK